MKIFISGKITGDENYRQKFQEAEDKLRSMYPDATLVNPVKLCVDIPEDAPHGEFMERCIDTVRTCDAIWPLDDWHRSKGAIQEVMFALGNGIEIL